MAARAGQTVAKLGKLVGRPDSPRRATSSAVFVVDGGRLAAMSGAGAVGAGAGASTAAAQFSAQWRRDLDDATADHNSAVARFWTQVFANIAGDPAARGARPLDALRLYASGTGVGGAGADMGGLVQQLTDVRSAAVINAESLRVAVEAVGDFGLLSTLYASSLSQADVVLTEMVEVVQGELKRPQRPAGDTSDAGDGAAIATVDEGGRAVANGRGSEWAWLLDLADRMPQTMLDRLVAHRGFHCTKDGTDRPIENTLEAYECAWTAGIQLCECDVALTKDGRVVLAHDASYERMALLKSPPMSPMPDVTAMTYPDLIRTRLLSGARPPLLEDVLASARDIGGKAQMVIEIKAGNSDMPAALCKLLRARPELTASISIVMSFDLEVMHQFAALFRDGSMPGADGVKLLFLTVSAPDDDDPFSVYRVLNLCTKDSEDQIPGWLRREASALDGVYIQYEPCMLEEDGRHQLEKLARDHTVGVWGYSTDPDDTASFESLVSAGAHFVNTDLPRTFESEVPLRGKEA